ncbi:Acetyltransferase (GNAT) domain-containing protein [Paenibacillus sp. UNC496MF]|uniref:GNAT family N-acetyltransferase n=1 Tax=Paenibacillus sp. UNC496MF TaxID=1502753 RepID=UPI0008F036E4|nr:GNAT family N-acetyltransferase [Paenibacillus sp. UNC496MF]SFJ70570.1 Acetyltransferase (GNAT) domain-containing protein [Paenibacillus sp. UNC496MF]
MTSIQERIKQNMIAMRERMSGVCPRIVFERTPRAIRHQSDLPHPVYNRVLAYSGTSPEDVLDDVGRLSERYRARKVPFTWLTWPHDPGAASLAEALAAHGLDKVDEVSGMSLSLAGWTYEGPAIPGFTVRPIRTRAEMAWFREIVPDRFGFHGEAADVLVRINEAAAMGRHPAFRHYVGFADGRPAAAATAFRDGETIGIYNVATLDGYRRRGLGTALTAHALREGQAAGARLAVLQSSRMGEGVYRSLGFGADVAIGIYLG